jgi:hypothetical protein
VLAIERELFAVNDYAYGEVDYEQEKDETDYTSHDSAYDSSSI